MVWEGYTDTLFTKPFEDACGVKVNATYMGSSDDLVAKLRAGGAETIDLISPSSDAPPRSSRPAWPRRSTQAHSELRRPERGVPEPQGREEGHRGVRRAVGVRPQPADLRQHQDQAGARLVGRAVGQEVPGQALAPGRHRHALHGRAVSRHGRSQRSEQALQPVATRTSPRSSPRCSSSSRTSGSTGSPRAT